MLIFRENLEKLILAWREAEISFSRFSRKISILEYMLLHNSNINVDITHIFMCKKRLYVYQGQSKQKSKMGVVNKGRGRELKNRDKFNFVSKSLKYQIPLRKGSAHTMLADAKYWLTHPWLINFAHWFTLLFRFLLCFIFFRKPDFHINIFLSVFTDSKIMKK